MRSAASSLLSPRDEGSVRSLRGRSPTTRRGGGWSTGRAAAPARASPLLSGAARKAAHRLLATGLSERAYAQAMGIVALEEVLDRKEQWRRGRHSGDYWVSVYGDPDGDQPWSWRFEGHHLSVTMTVAGAEVSPAPVFFGANPACVSYGGHPVSRPLGPEEDLVLALLDAMGRADPFGRRGGGPAPGRHPHRDQPPGQPEHRAARRARHGARTGRAGPARPNWSRPTWTGCPRSSRLARRAWLDGSELHFAWEGPRTPGARHYYRVQGDDLLIEYDTTADGNHAHTVLRRPRSDFGATYSLRTTPGRTAEQSGQVVQARWMMTGLLRAPALS